MNVRGLGYLLAQLPLDRCPQCGVARPQMIGLPALYSESVGGLPGRYWRLFRCTACGQMVLAATVPCRQGASNPLIEDIYPGLRTAADELPQAARKFLQQAYETLHAPDAAAVMAGSAVDAMLKAKGYDDGSLYSRIDKAVADHVLTREMGEWAHWVRLGSNRPRHADKDTPHVSASEAQQSVEFAHALGEFLFVLSSRISKGIEEAQSPSGIED